MHVVSLRWGTVTAIDADEDSQAVVQMMTALADTGITEAEAAPILT